jgi:hypothetical protein
LRAIQLEGTARVGADPDFTDARHVATLTPSPAPAQPLLEQDSQSAVPSFNRLPESGLALCFQGKAPQTFVERVDREAAFRGFECIGSVSSIEPGTTDALEELSVRAAEAPDVAFRPCVIATGEGRCAEGLKRLLEEFPAAVIPASLARSFQELPRVRRRRFARGHGRAGMTECHRQILRAFGSQDLT